MIRRAVAALALLSGPVLAQPPAPLFECQIEAHASTFESFTGSPSSPTMTMTLRSGFAFDAATGLMRWRNRQTGQLGEPDRWRVVAQGRGGNDWVAVNNLDPALARDIEILRIRMWGRNAGRFVIFDGIGMTLTGTCR